MTMKEAVEVIKTAQSQVEWDYPMDYAAAFDLAIKALEAQDGTDTNVGGTISRQAAIDAVLSVIPDDEYWKEQVERAISAQPSAQPEIIREIRKWINSSNRGNADYFIVDKIEEIINKYE